jgi:protein involved in polysaccharide export with SLBB domain
MKKLNLILLSLALCFAAPIFAQQTYIIERDDFLSIAFWQQPTLNTQIRVAADGTIELPTVGKVNAAGYTLEQLEKEIVRQYAFYNAKVTQAKVAMIEFGSKKAYINGQVPRPGKYTFAAMPTLWQLILEAGGPLETANLGQVSLVRGSGEEMGKVSTVDLADVLNRNAINELPRLMPGDIVYIPAVPGGPAAAGRSPLKKSSVVYIYGEITNPGEYQYENNTNILEAMIKAGGPTEKADLRRVRIVGSDSLQTQVAQINLQKYHDEPQQPPLVLHGGDTIYIPKRQSILGSVGGMLLETTRIAVVALVPVLAVNSAR